MQRVLLPVLLTVLLSGCSVLSAPANYIDSQLSRDDDVFNRHGLDLDRVNVGDSRQTVHDLWGMPRNTHPTYRDFDVYLGVRNSGGDWRVLPGEFNDLKRTTPLIVQVSYVDDFVNAIFLFGQDAFGNSRAWCDDTNLCAELFPYHASAEEQAPTNPLLVSVRETGFVASELPGDTQCELVVFASSEDPNWIRRLNFVELAANDVPIGFLSAGTYHVSRHATGDLSVRVWPNFEYSGEIRQDLRDDWDNTLDLNCLPGERYFVEVGPEQTGMFTLNPGLRIDELDESAALQALAVKRAIVSSSNSPPLAGTGSAPGKAHLRQ